MQSLVLHYYKEVLTLKLIGYLMELNSYSVPRETFIFSKIVKFFVLQSLFWNCDCQYLLRVI